MTLSPPLFKVAISQKGVLDCGNSSCKGHYVCLTHSNICVAFNQSVIPIPTCFITYLMGHIVVGCNFGDLQVRLNVPNTNKRIGFLNVNENEVIHNLFYNKTNDSLIVVLKKCSF